MIMPDIASIFGRWEFVIRRLHSLTGLLPVGAFLFVHLFTNVSILDGPKTFQLHVDQIHSLGPVTLFYVEWLFIFLPILFHGLIGSIIVLRGKRNVWAYPYAENFRYTLQRWTGVIALAFILWHVFHTRGWFISPWWQEHVTRPLGGGTFDAKHAAETAAAAIQASALVAAVYAVGVLASVYHLANGLWTMGITWGAWTSPHAQRWATAVCAAVGIGLATMGVGALVGMLTTTIP
jgi:succinate dehydrogenase / fumarate reductase, cytochrome b subunit